MSTKFAYRAVFVSFGLASALAAQTESVLIRAARPYTNLIRAIEERGGRVTLQYQNFMDSLPKSNAAGWMPSRPLPVPVILRRICWCPVPPP